MIEGIITSVADKIKAAFQATIGNWVSLDWIPEIVFWYWWLFVLLIVVLLIIRIFGWIKVVQIGASLLLLGGAIFVAGGHWMKHRMDQAAAKKAAKAKPKPKLKPPASPTWTTWGS